MEDSNLFFCLMEIKDKYLLGIRLIKITPNRGKHIPKNVYNNQSKLLWPPIAGKIERSDIGRSSLKMIIKLANLKQIKWNVSIIRVLVPIKSRILAIRKVDNFSEITINVVMQIKANGNRMNRFNPLGVIGIKNRDMTKVKTMDIIEIGNEGLRFNLQ